MCTMTLNVLVFLTLNSHTSSNDTQDELGYVCLCRYKSRKISYCLDRHLGFWISPTGVWTSVYVLLVSQQE